MPNNIPPAPFGRTLTAMVTPFTAEGAIDIDSGVALARHLVDRKNDGIVLNGTTGEAPATHTPEKSEFVRQVVEAVGDQVKIVAGVGSNDTAHTLRMAEHAQAAGAHGLLIVTPYYSRPSQAGLIAHIAKVASAVDLPILLYDVPSRAGIKYTLESLKHLADIPNVVGYKDATGDLYTAAKGIASTDLAWYCGDDSAYVPFLSVGASGIISVASHLVSEEFAQIADLFAAGDLEGARAVFAKIFPAIDAVNGFGHQATATKAALVELGVLPRATVRLPNVEVDEQELAAIRGHLRQAGLLA